MPQRCSVSSSLRCFLQLSPKLRQESKSTYRTDGDFFNLRRLKSYTKVTRAIVRDFLFADDCALAAHSEVDLQELADCFATAAKIFGLTVSIKKTEVLRQLAPNIARPPPNISMDGNALKNVDTFKYLGSCINSAGNLDDEVLCHISRASQAFERLHTRVWHERGIAIKTKLSVYRAVVLLSLLYGCETWTCYRRHIKKLDQFHLRCLRKVLRVSWKDHVPNQEILRRAELTGIEGHVEPGTASLVRTCHSHGRQQTPKTTVPCWALNWKTAQRQAEEAVQRRAEIDPQGLQHPS